MGARLPIQQQPLPVRSDAQKNSTFCIDMDKYIMYFYLIASPEARPWRQPFFDNLGTPMTGRLDLFSAQNSGEAMKCWVSPAWSRQ